MVEPEIQSTLNGSQAMSPKDLESPLEASVSELDGGSGQDQDSEDPKVEIEQIMSEIEELQKEMTSVSPELASKMAETIDLKVLDQAKDQLIALNDKIEDLEIQETLKESKALQDNEENHLSDAPQESGLDLGHSANLEENTSASLEPTKNENLESMGEDLKVAQLNQVEENAMTEPVLKESQNMQLDDPEISGNSELSHGQSLETEEFIDLKMDQQEEKLASNIDEAKALTPNEMETLDKEVSTSQSSSDSQKNSTTALGLMHFDSPGEEPWLEETMAQLKIQEASSRSLLDSQISDGPVLGLKGKNPNFTPIFNSSSQAVLGGVTMNVEGEMYFRFYHGQDGSEILIQFQKDSIKIVLRDGTEFKIPIAQVAKSSLKVA